jgi:hypothetical protein
MMTSRSFALLVALTAFLSVDAADAGGKLEKPSSSDKAQGSSDRTVASSPRSSDRVAVPNAVRAQAKAELVFSAPIHYQNISLVPILTSAQGPFQKFTLLEAGLESKNLEVRELKGHSGEAQVNAVEVKNSGNYPAYLLGGEMILGGKQDRIIESDTIVPNNQKWTRVSVFCVEQGRWHGQNMKFGAARALAHIALRQAALSGDQSKVWAEVAAKNRQQGTENATGTYRRTIQNTSVRKKITPYRTEITKMLPADKQLAGLIFAINGKIRVADIFGNPVLFTDVRDKLLSAYILEALGQQVDPNAPVISRHAAKGFIDYSRKSGKIKRATSSGASINYKVDNPDIVGDETLDKASGQSVRESYIKK